MIGGFSLDVRGVAFVRRKNYGLAGRFQHAFIRLIEIAWLASLPTINALSKKQRWNPSMRKTTRPFLVEIRRGDRHVPKTATKLNNVAASRTPQPSHFPQNIMSQADQTFDGSHSATSTGLGEPQTLTAPSCGLPPSPMPTGRILPCLLPVPLLDQTSDNARSVSLKRRKQAVKRIAVMVSFDAGLKGRAKVEFENPNKVLGRSCRNSIQ